jgi:hypothetical protein
VPADVTGNFSTTGRVTNVDRVFQVECGHELGQVVGIGGHIVAVPRLARPAVAAAVVRDDSVALLAENNIWASVVWA